jgi:hypothetical protein
MINVVRTYVDFYLIEEILQIKDVLGIILFYLSRFVSFEILVIKAQLMSTINIELGFTEMGRFRDNSCNWEQGRNIKLE